MLTDLVYCDFLRKYNVREKNVKINSAIYQLIDFNTINRCEVKYSEDLYSLDKEEFLKIQNRIKAFKEVTGTRSSIIPTMITTFGMKEGMYSDQIIAKIDMDALF